MNKLFEKENKQRRELSLCSRYYYGPEQGRKDENHKVLTIADMDFEVPQPLKDVVIKRAQEGNWVYTFGESQLPQSINKWLSERFGISVSLENLVWGNGVLVMMQLALMNITKEGDNVIIQTPVYTPFFGVIEHLKRNIVENKLTFDEDYKFHMDFEDLEKKMKDPKTTCMLLCSPHNPVGRVWTKEELQRVHDLAKANNVFVIADEIWMDIIHKDNKHTPFITLSKWAEQNCAMCTSATKTFNLGGIQHGYAIVKNKELFNKMYETMNATFHVGSHNIFNIFIMEEAYNNAECAKWLDDANEVIEANHKTMVEMLKDTPIKIAKQDGIYVTWLEFKDCGINSKEDLQKMLLETNTTLSMGYNYGADYTTCLRMNIAQAPSVVKDVTQRLVDYVSKNK